jgi:hypothetical protein
MLLKKYFLACMTRDLQEVQAIEPEIMQPAEFTPVIKFVRLIMVRIACSLEFIALLQHCLSSAPSSSELLQISLFDDTYYTFGTYRSPTIWNAYLDGMLMKRDMSSEGFRHLMNDAIHRMLPEYQVELVRSLLDHGANVDGELLYHAASKGTPETMRLILFKCDASKMEDSEALGASAQEEDTGVPEVLLDSGMDINHMPGNIGLEDMDPMERSERETYGGGIWVGTPLHYAADGEFVAAVRVLLDRGARTDIKDSRGKTALQAANEKGRTGCAGLISAAVSKDGDERSSR